MAINSELSMSCETEGAEIRYTLDGSEPNENSTLYSNPLSLSGYTVVKAKAYKDGMTPTDVYTLEFGENKDGEEIEMIKKSFTFQNTLDNERNRLVEFLSTCDFSKFISGKIFNNNFALIGNGNSQCNLNILGISKHPVTLEAEDVDAYSICYGGWIYPIVIGVINVNEVQWTEDLNFNIGNTGTDINQIGIGGMLNDESHWNGFKIDLYFES